MSNATLREALAGLVHLKDAGPAQDDILCHVYQAEADAAWSMARAALDADDAARGTMREQFEAWISAPPFEHECDRLGEESAWPGNYERYETELAWCAWQASRAAAPQSVEPVAISVVRVDNAVPFSTLMSEWSKDPAKAAAIAEARADAEWQEEAMRLATQMMRESWATGDDAAWQPAYQALRAHIATRPLPAPATKKEQP